jgi:hypothetical protein
MPFQGTEGQTKSHCAMKDLYEMPQMTVVEMEVQGAVMKGSGDDIDDGGSY